MELTEALGLDAALVKPSLERFRVHPVCLQASNDFERCKRWGKWLINEKYAPNKGIKDVQLLEGDK